MKPVRVEIITYAPTVYSHCQHCEIAFHHVGVGPQLRRDEANDSLPLDLQFEYLDVATWARDLKQRKGDAVAVRVIDAASLQGVWASLRYGVRSYPAVVVGGREKRVGRDFRSLDPVVDQMVADRIREGGPNS